MSSSSSTSSSSPSSSSSSESDSENEEEEYNNQRLADNAPPLTVQVPSMSEPGKIVRKTQTR